MTVLEDWARSVVPQKQIASLLLLGRFQTPVHRLWVGRSTWRWMCVPETSGPALPLALGS